MTMTAHPVTTTANTIAYSARPATGLHASSSAAAGAYTVTTADGQTIQVQLAVDHTNPAIRTSPTTIPNALVAEAWPLTRRPGS
jgi:hypothetical protein